MGLLSWLKPRRKGVGIRDSYPVAIANARDGATIKIVGRLVYAGKLLEAPLTGRACACWQVTVERLNPDRPFEVVWQVVADDQGARDFFVEDRSGIALVRGTSLRPTLVKDARFDNVSLGRAAPTAGELLDRLGYGSPRSSQGLQFKEGVLEPGKEVAVYGIARWEPDPEGAEGGATYRDIPMRLVMAPTDDGTIHLSDSPWTLA